LTTGRIRIAWAAYWLLLFAAMHTPRDRLPRISLSFVDKLVHFGGYGVLAVFSVVAATRAGRCHRAHRHAEQRAAG